MHNDPNKQEGSLNGSPPWLAQDQEGSLKWFSTLATEKWKEMHNRCTCGVFNDVLHLWQKNDNLRTETGPWHNWNMKQWQQKNETVCLRNDSRDQSFLPVLEIQEGSTSTFNHGEGCSMRVIMATVYRRLHMKMLNEAPLQKSRVIFSRTDRSTLTLAGKLKNPHHPQQQQHGLCSSSSIHSTGAMEAMHAMEPERTSSSFRLEEGPVNIPLQDQTEAHPLQRQASWMQSSSPARDDLIVHTVSHVALCFMCLSWRRTNKPSLQPALSGDLFTSSESKPMLIDGT